MTDAGLTTAGLIARRAALLLALAACTACGKQKKVDQLRADSVAVEGDIFLWGNTVARLQQDSATTGRVGNSSPESTVRALQTARARLADAVARRTTVIRDLSIAKQ